MGSMSGMMKALILYWMLSGVTRSATTRYLIVALHTIGYLGIKRLIARGLDARINAISTELLIRHLSSDLGCVDGLATYAMLQVCTVSSPVTGIEH